MLRPQLCATFPISNFQSDASGTRSSVGLLFPISNFQSHASGARSSVGMVFPISNFHALWPRSGFPLKCFQFPVSKRNPSACIGDALCFLFPVPERASGGAGLLYDYFLFPVSKTAWGESGRGCVVFPISNFLSVSILSIFLSVVLSFFHSVPAKVHVTGAALGAGRSCVSGVVKSNEYVIGGEEFCRGSV